MSDALNRGGFLATCSAKAGVIKDRVFLAGGDTDGSVDLGDDGLARNLNPDDPNAGRIDIVSLLKVDQSGNERVLPLWDYARLPLPRSLLGLVSSDNFLYIAGGQLSIRDNSGGGYDYSKNLVKIVDVFKSDGSWVKSFELSEARAEVKGMFHDGKLYFVGGFNGKTHPEYGSLCVGGRCYYRSSTIDIYDEATSSLETLSMPADAIAPLLFVWQNQLWVLPGQSNYVDRVRAASQQEIWIMDLAAKTWTIEYLDRRLSGGLLKVDARLYFLNSATAQLDVYSLETKTWTDIQLPEPISAGLCLLNNKLVTLPGETVPQVMNEQAQSYPYLLMYDFTTGTWRKTKHPNLRGKMTTVCVDNRFYMSAGGIQSTRTVAQVDIFDSKTETWYENYGAVQESVTEDF